jgi:hypothetical protein
VECESCGYRSKELQTMEDLIRDHNKRVLAPIKEPEKIVYCISSPVRGFVKTYGIDRIENNVCIRLATFKNLESAKIFAKELGFPFKENDNG